MGLKVGQAHHALDEAIGASKNDMTIRSTFLDSRLVAGDAVRLVAPIQGAMHLMSAPPGDARGYFMRPRWGGGSSTASTFMRL
jgi:hypothetical protein